MAAIHVFALAVVLIGVVANLAVSFAVVRSHYYSRKQKVAQLFIVWLLPFVGALGVGAFLYSQRDNPMFDTRAYPEPSQKAVAITIQESVHGHHHAD